MHIGGMSRFERYHMSMAGGCGHSFPQRTKIKEVAPDVAPAGASVRGSCRSTKKHKKKLLNMSSFGII